MKKLIILFAVLVSMSTLAHSQGCVVVRNISGFGQYNMSDNDFSTSKWQVNMNSRYFKAFRDFKGTQDQNTPLLNQSIVRSYSMDISVSRFLNKGWSVNLSLPFIANSRSTTLEHGGAGTPRYSTHSRGIGDLRLSVLKWLLQPSLSQKTNVQLGLGIKLPTGNYKYQDYFIRNNTKVLAPVNPSIQLGDGGTGIISELNGFYIFNEVLNFYGNVYYLMSPKEQNGVSTTFGRSPTPIQVQSGNTTASVTDQFSMRAGIDVNIQKLTLLAGLRKEGVPVNDVIGGSNGTRRAGYNLSFEPGLIYKLNKASVYAYLPVIISRKIKQTVPDKKASEITGVYTISQGGFANYLMFTGVAFNF